MLTSKTLLGLFFCCLIKNSYYALAFDPTFYLTTYPELRRLGIHSEIGALVHYLNNGFYQHKLAAPPLINTNFDWHYYIHINNLQHITSEQEALHHYHTIGRIQNLQYCKKFTIGILLHLYNLNLADEFIEKINYFMNINNLNNFYIKINIPIDKNLFMPCPIFSTPLAHTINDKDLFQEVLNLTPYHKQLITPHNFKRLYIVAHYLRSRLKNHPEKVQIIFSENRGLDIGGFFLLLDQVIKQNLPTDYIIKLHSKTWHSWRALATSLLNLRVNRLLNSKKYIYTCNLSFAWNTMQTAENIKNVHHLLQLFKLPKLNFKFAAGTMFIVSGEFVHFFKNYNLINLFNSLNIFATHPTIETIEHAYERLFGCLTTCLQLPPQVIGYVTRSKDGLIN